MFAATKAFFARVASLLPAPSWALDFSAGEPWANGTNYNYRSLRTAGTYVNSSGYIATNAANLCLQSEDFGTTWVNTHTTETTNTTTAPDGTMTADTVTEGSIGTLARERRISTANITFAAGLSYTLSVYAKADTATVIQFSVADTTFGTDFWQNFDLANGVRGSAGTAAGLVAGMENVGNGWYRCWLKGDNITTNARAFNISFTDNNPTATRNPSYVNNSVARSLWLWGAQVVVGSSPLPYSLTTTSTNGIPRLTHDKTGNRLGLLIEESRTNSLPNSEDFTTSWSGGNCNVTANAVTAPTNTLVADQVAANTTNAAHWLRRTVVSPVAGTTYVYSVFFKAGGGAATHAVLQIETTGVDRSYAAKYDTTTGARTDTDSTNSPVNTDSPTQAEDFGNGWWRAWVRIQHATGNTGLRAYVGLSNAATGIALPVFAGAAGNADFIYFWGAQVEQSTTTPTSFIPTATVSVIRPEEFVSLLDSLVTSWGDPGALVVHFYPPGQAGTIISTDDGANTQLGIEASSTTAARAFWSSGSTSTGTIGTSGVQKAVHYWNGTNSRFSINGSSVVSGTNDITSFGAIDFLTLGAEATDSGGVPASYTKWPNVIIRKVEWRAGTWTDAQLQEMTQ
jgi:hypothetical protein